MDSLTFCTAGGWVDAGDFLELQPALVEGYPDVEHPPVVYVARYGGAQVNGFACIERVGGFFVQPARVVLGLRAWHDAFEGVFLGERPWVLFEAEKIVRMMLRQSGLALEILASPLAVGLQWDAREIVRGAVSREIVLYYRDVTRLGVARLLALGESERLDEFEQGDKVWLQDLFRHLLTGSVLGTQGHVSLHLDALLDFAVADGVREPLSEVVLGAVGRVQMLAALRELGEQAVRLQGGLEVEQARVLPERPSDYGGLNEWLVDQRFGRSNAS